MLFLGMLDKAAFMRFLISALGVPFLIIVTMLACFTSYESVNCYWIEETNRSLNQK